MKKGFTLIETLVVIAILTVLFGVVLKAFYTQSRTASAERDAQSVLTLLQRARNQSLASIDNSSFGVRFTASSSSFFKGTSYSAAATQEISSMGAGIVLTTALTGGVTQLYFNRLSGEPSATGTITITPSALGTTSAKVIIIRGTGLAEIQ